jgi:ParB family chromosome partitioning protein
MDHKKEEPRRALGRGLSSLIRPPSAAAPAFEAPEVVQKLPVGRLTPNPYQPRKKFDEASIAELAASIQQQGIVQPIVVRLKDGQYQIVAGERRWRAAKSLKLTEVPVVVQAISDESLLEIGLIENIQREDLNAIELAHAYAQLSEDLRLNHEEVAQRVGKDRASVSNTLRLLNLTPEVQKLVLEDKLSAGHARVLIRIEERVAQIDMAKRAVAQNLSVRDLERMVITAQPKKVKEEKPPPPPDPNVKAAVDQLERRLGTRVRVLETKKGKGKIEIDYYSEEDLNRIYELIAGEENR